MNGFASDVNPGDGTRGGLDGDTTPHPHGARPGPLPVRMAWAGVGRCVWQTARLLGTRRVHLPRDEVGRIVRFADGSSAQVYRETRLDRTAAAAPCVLVVCFRLRGVRGRGHSVFRAESLLNTPLFVGFPGFVSKLWMAHDEKGRYRGIYDWDGAEAARRYAGCLWRVLALVSVPGSVDYRVVEGAHREEVLAGSAAVGPQVRGDDTWWVPTGAPSTAPTGMATPP